VVEFDVQQKTCFKVLEYPVIIERNNKPFFDNSETRASYFNLPEGKYFLFDGEIVETDKSLVWEVEIPEREIFIKKPKKIYLYFDKSPFKAHMFRKQGVIVISKKYLNYPFYTIEFLKQHELAHYLYETEKFCDLYAASEMLKMGYCPSQIYLAMQETFAGDTERVEERINFVERHLIEIR